MKLRKKQPSPRPIRLPAKSRPAVAPEKYVLRLFVAGASARSHQAIVRVRQLCETILQGRVKLEIFDIYQQPKLAHAHQIVATPTLIIALPRPVRRFIGNLTTLTDLFGLVETDKKGPVIL
jgi:circadian clock protein KaiB